MRLNLDLKTMYVRRRINRLERKNIVSIEDDVLQGEGGGSWVTRSERKRGLGEGRTQQCCGNRHYTSCTSRLH